MNQRSSRLPLVMAVLISASFAGTAFAQAASAVITKSFNPAVVPLNGISIGTITVTNPNAVAAHERSVQRHHAGGDRSHHPNRRHVQHGRNRRRHVHHQSRHGNLFQHIECARRRPVLHDYRQCGGHDPRPTRQHDVASHLQRGPTRRRRVRNAHGDRRRAHIVRVDVDGPCRRIGRDGRNQTASVARLNWRELWTILEPQCSIP